MQTRTCRLQNTDSVIHVNVHTQQYSSMGIEIQTAWINFGKIWSPHTGLQPRGTDPINITQPSRLTFQSPGVEYQALDTNMTPLGGTQKHTALKYKGEKMVAAKNEEGVLGVNSNKTELTPPLLPMLLSKMHHWWILHACFSFAAF